MSTILLTSAEVAELTDTSYPAYQERWLIDWAHHRGKVRLGAGIPWRSTHAGAHAPLEIATGDLDALALLVAPSVRPKSTSRRGLEIVRGRL